MKERLINFYNGIKKELITTAIVSVAAALLIWASFKFGFIGALLLGIVYVYLMVGDE